MLAGNSLKLLLAVAQTKKPTSTVSLAEAAGISQQSASRLLQELAKEGLVRKRQLAQGLDVALTAKGTFALRELQGRLGKALGARAAVLRGTVETGMGEGKYYMSMAHYRRAIGKLLGQEPYPGTLNLHVDPEERSLFLGRLLPAEVPGYASRERTYGPVAYYDVMIVGRKCALILPRRTSYGHDKAELVAAFSFRTAMGLQDGDTVIVEAPR